MARMVFEKTGDSIWISHLDLMRVFQRAFRRAGLLLKHSQGFTPRAIVSIALPLSVGVESRCELLDFELEDGSVPTVQQLNDKLPEGIRAVSIAESGRKLKELTHLLACLQLVYDNGVPAGAADGISALFEGEELILEKHSRKGDTKTDILPLLHKLELKQTDEKTLQMDALVCAQNPSLNPLLLIAAIERYAPQWTPDGTTCTRMEIFDADGKVFR